MMAYAVHLAARMSESECKIVSFLHRCVYSNPGIMLSMLHPMVLGFEVCRVEEQREDGKNCLHFRILLWEI